MNICAKDDSKQVKGLVLVVQSLNLELGTRPTRLPMKVNGKVEFNQFQQKKMKYSGEMKQKNKKAKQKQNNNNKQEYYVPLQVS